MSKNLEGFITGRHAIRLLSTGLSLLIFHRYLTAWVNLIQTSKFAVSIATTYSILPSPYTILLVTKCTKPTFYLQNAVCHVAHSLMRYWRVSDEYMFRTCSGLGQAAAQPTWTSRLEPRRHFAMFPCPVHNSHCNGGRFQRREQLHIMIKYCSHRRIIGRGRPRCTDRCVGGYKIPTKTH